MRRCPECKAMHESDPRYCPDCGAETKGFDHPKKHIIEPVKKVEQEQQKPASVNPTREAIEFLQLQQRERSGNLKGCGCLLIVASILLFFTGPIAGVIFIVGLIVFIAGLVI